MCFADTDKTIQYEVGVLESLEKSKLNSRSVGIYKIGNIKKRKALAANKYCRRWVNRLQKESSGAESVTFNIEKHNRNPIVSISLFLGA